MQNSFSTASKEERSLPSRVSSSSNVEALPVNSDLRGLPDEKCDPVFVGPNQCFTINGPEAAYIKELLKMEYVIRRRGVEKYCEMIDDAWHDERIYVLLTACVRGLADRKLMEKVGVSTSDLFAVCLYFKALNFTIPVINTIHVRNNYKYEDPLVDFTDTSRVRLVQGDESVVIAGLIDLVPSREPANPSSFCASRSLVHSAMGVADHSFHARCLMDNGWRVPHISSSAPPLSFSQAVFLPNGVYLVEGDGPYDLRVLQNHVQALDRMQQRVNFVDVPICPGSEVINFTLQMSGVHPPYQFLVGGKPVSATAFDTRCHSWAHLPFLTKAYCSSADFRSEVQCILPTSITCETVREFGFKIIALLDRFGFDHPPLRVEEDEEDDDEEEEEEDEEESSSNFSNSSALPPHPPRVHGISEAAIAFSKEVNDPRYLERLRMAFAFISPAAEARLNGLITLERMKQAKLMAWSNTDGPPICQYQLEDEAQLLINTVYTHMRSLAPIYPERLHSFGKQSYACIASLGDSFRTSDLPPFFTGVPVGGVVIPEISEDNVVFLRRCILVSNVESYIAEKCRLPWVHRSGLFIARGSNIITYCLPVRVSATHVVALPLVSCPTGGRAWCPPWLPLLLSFYDEDDPPKRTHLLGSMYAALKRKICPIKMEFSAYAPYFPATKFFESPDRKVGHHRSETTHVPPPYMKMPWPPITRFLLHTDLCTLDDCSCSLQHIRIE